jgi:hypothetical protein
MSGSYYNPSTSGEGFDLQISENTVVAYFFGYNGSENTWLIGSGANETVDGVTTIDAYQTENFEGEVLYSKTGTMTIVEESETDLFISWTMEYDYARLRQPGVTMPWCLTGMCFGDKEVTALFRPTLCE